MGELSKGLVKVLITVTVIFQVQITFSANAYADGSMALANQCSRLFSDLSEQTTKSSPLKGELKIGTYNLLNLFLHAGNIRKKNSKPSEKPLWATKEIAKVLLDENYDIFVAQEVESIGSAQKFNKEYLHDQYNVFSTTTKDVRGLFVVFFVKKNLPYYFKLESHANETWFDPLKDQEAALFERDLPTLHIYKNAEDEKPMLTMMGVHFKSKRHRHGDRIPGSGESEIEFESNRLREAQANRATQIIQRYQIQFGYDHPILIAGDFNSNHNYAPEFVGFLRHTKLSDTVGLKKQVERYSDRTTHSYFGGERPKHNQLDGILITPSLVGFLQDSYVVKYKEENGSNKDIPRTKDERKKNPSDHRPITAIFVFDN